MTFRTPPVEVSVALRLGGTAALLVCLFATAWFGRSVPAPGPFASAHGSAVSGWSTVGPVRWLLLAVAGGTIGSLVRPSLGRGLRWIGVVACLWLATRLFWLVPDPGATLDVKVGGYLAWVGAVALTLGLQQAPESPPGR